MSYSDENVESQQTLSKLSRHGAERAENVSVVTSPGARVNSWAIKVKSHYSYNVYNVCMVDIGGPGTLPVEISGTVQAVNVAESFLQTGQLPAGTYAVMSRVGERNVFYAYV